VSRDDAFTVEEDMRGAYIFNSKDLCLIEKIPELIEAGINSFKVEGRMKTAYYVAMTAKIYREAIDTYCADPAHYTFRPLWREEMANISHRPYTTGFYFGDAVQNPESSAYIRGYDFCGVIEEYDQTLQRIFVAVRNRIGVGDTIDIVDPHEQLIRPLKIEKLIRANGEILATAHNSYRVYIPVPADFGMISAQSLLRKKN
jgi:putative protease